LRADREEVSTLTAEDEQRLTRAIDSEIENAQVVIISDYGKGVITPRIAAHIVRVARAAKKPVIVDTKASDFAAFRGANVVTPNARELAAAARVPASSDSEVETAAARLIADLDLGALVVTRSEHGMSIFER